MLKTPSLIAGYPFEGNANDASGNGYDATVFGASLHNDGVPFGSAYLFDGIDDYISIPHDTQLNERLHGGFSISMGIIRLSDISGARIIAKGSYATSQDGFELIPHPTANRYQFRIHGDATVNIPSESSPLDVWQHIVFTVDSGGSVKGYVDGGLRVEGQTHPPSSIINTRNMAIGARSDGDAASNFHGIIDNVRIYEGVLSPSDIKRLVHSLHPLGK